MNFGRYWNKIKSWYNIILWFENHKPIAGITLSVLAFFLLDPTKTYLKDKFEVDKRVKNLFDTPELILNLDFDPSFVKLKRDQVGLKILYRENDCRFKQEADDFKKFVVTCSNASEGESIHFQVLINNKPCLQRDKLMGEEHTIPIEQCEVIESVQ